MCGLTNRARLAATAMPTCADLTNGVRAELSSYVPDPMRRMYPSPSSLGSYRWQRARSCSRRYRSNKHEPTPSEFSNPKFTAHKLLYASEGLSKQPMRKVKAEWTELAMNGI
jgi:hypothetical protein